MVVTCALVCRCCQEKTVNRYQININGEIYTIVQTKSTQGEYVIASSLDVGSTYDIVRRPR
jgi:hypothetical protein